MGLIQTSDGQQRPVPHAVAQNIWDVLTGKEEGTPQQQRYAESVKRVYLPWRTAPDDYVRQYYDLVMHFALMEWMVDRKGILTRPSDEHGWAFARKWGLWENGQPTEYVRKYSREHGPESRYGLIEVKGLHT